MAIYVATQCVCKLSLITRIQRVAVTRQPAVERLGHGFDPLANREIANSHLPEILIHVGEHQIKQRLCCIGGNSALSAESAQNQRCVDHHHVEAAVGGVGNSKLGVKERVPCLLNDPLIETEGCRRQSIRLRAAGPGDQFAKREHSVCLMGRIPATKPVLAKHIVSRRDRREAASRRESGFPRSGSRYSLRIAALIVGGLLLGLPGCASRTQTHGDPVEPEQLARIVPRTHTKADVQALLGSPSSAAPFVDDAWYYISARMEGLAFLPDEEVERQVVVIRFDPQNVVSAVDVLELAQGREVALVKRETPTFGEDTSVLQQFLGNIGRFEKEQPQRR